VASDRLLCIVAGYAFELSFYGFGMSDAALEDSQDILRGRVVLKSRMNRSAASQF
jgi:hypothetical protein